jgi:hypothetical protein
MPRPKKKETEDIKKKTIQNKAQKETRNKAVFLMNDAKEELLLQFSKNIGKEISKRRNEFMQCLEDFEVAHTDENGVLVIGKKENVDVSTFVDNAFSPIIKVAGNAPKYSANDIYMALDYFKDCVREINKVGFYIPMKEDFCTFINISTRRFEDYKNGNDLEMREVCVQVDDYIAKMATQAGMLGKIEKLTGMYYQRVALKRVEPKEPEKPTTVINNLVLSDSEMRELARKYSDE